jgi:hypothetical protein
LEVGVVKKLTAAVGPIGLRIFDGPELVRIDYNGFGAVRYPLPRLRKPRAIQHASPLLGLNPPTSMTNAATGLRFNPIGHFLISGNVPVNLDNGGLRGNVVPLIAVSYTFK